MRIKLIQGVIIVGAILGLYTQCVDAEEHSPVAEASEEVVSNPLDEVHQEMDKKKLVNESDVMWLCEKFMLSVSVGSLDDAFSTLQPYSSVPDDELEKFKASAKQQMLSVVELYGAVLNYSFVSKKVAADCFLEMTYIQKFEKYAIRWRFFFYKAQDTWAFNEFTVDNKLDDLFI